MRALRSSKTPDRFWLLEALPRTETGKLLRRMVPGLIAQAGSTQVSQSVAATESNSQPPSRCRCCIDSRKGLVSSGGDE